MVEAIANLEVLKWKNRSMTWWWSAAALLA